MFGRWLNARLPTNPDGSPETEGEQSNVVHDLLAHLAEQMITMNKEKQAETRGFLGWLADYTELPVEDWTLKTSLKPTTSTTGRRYGACWTATAARSRR